MSDPIAAVGKGIERTLVHSWPWPVWVAIVILIATCVSTYLAIRAETAANRRRYVLLGLRWSVLALVVLLLFGWIWQTYRTSLPDLVIAIDRSVSMSVSDPAGAAQGPTLKRLGFPSEPAPSRFELTRRMLSRDDMETLRTLARRYQIRLVLIGQSLGPIEGSMDEVRTQIEAATPDDTASRLGNGIREILERQTGRPTAAIVVLTDGINTDGPPLSEAAAFARRRDVPLYLVAMGDERPPRDVALLDPLAEDSVFVGDLLTFDAKVQHHGMDGKSVRVLLRRTDSNHVVDETKLTLGPAGESQPVRLAARQDSPGEFEYRLEVEPPAGDMLPHNHTWTHRVRVRDEVIRVLFVQAYPSPEYHFLKRLLQGSLRAPPSSPTSPATSADNSQRRNLVELHTVLQDADSEFASQEQSALRFFPTSRDALFQYDILILGDANPALLSRSSLENIREFVQTRGGGLVCLAGPRYLPSAYGETPLEKLLPASTERIRLPSPDALISSGFQARPSLLGLSTSQLQLADTPDANVIAWKQLPELYWLAEVHAPRPGVRRLIEHPNRVSEQGEPLSVVSLQFFGRGKVVFQATDETYRWSRAADGNSFYNRYWLQTIRFLARSKLAGDDGGIELTSDRTEYRVDEPIRIQARFADGANVAIEDDGVTVVVANSQGVARSWNLTREKVSHTFDVTIPELPTGEYKAWLSSPSVEGQPATIRFQVLAPDAELQRLQTDVKDLKQAAKTSGGRFYSWTDFERAFAEIPAGDRIRIEPLPPVPLWNSPWLAAIFVALLTSEWLLRRRWGMA